VNSHSDFSGDSDVRDEFDRKLYEVLAPGYNLPGLKSGGKEFREKVSRL
jgi:hypothetical protein